MPHLQYVAGLTKTIAPSITVGTDAYTANDILGGLLTLTGAARNAGQPVTLARVSVLDASNQKVQLELLFFSANPSASTVADDGAITIHANDEAKFIGRVTVYASDYLTVGSKAVACLTNIGLPMVAASTDLYMVILTPGTPTYAAADDLRISLAFYQD